MSTAVTRLVTLALSGDEADTVKFLVDQLIRQLGPYGNNVGYERDRKVWVITYTFDLTTMTSIETIQKRASDLFERVKKLGADLDVKPVGPVKKLPVVGNDSRSVKILIDLKV